MARPVLYRPLEGGDFDSLVDPQLQGDYDHAEMLRMVSCAAASIRHSGKRRPHMSQVQFEETEWELERIEKLKGDVIVVDSAKTKQEVLAAETSLISKLITECGSQSTKKSEGIG